QSKLVGNDRPHQRASAGAEVLRSDLGDDAAVARHRYGDDAARPTPASPFADATAKASAQNAILRKLSPPLPSDFPRSDVQLAVIGRVLEIPLTDLDWIDAEAKGELVEQRLHRKRGLRTSRSAHRTRTIHVGVQSVELGSRALDLVDVGLAVAAPGREPSQVVLLRLHGEQLPFAVGACLQLLPRTAAVAAHQELAPAVERHLHRSHRLLRK